MLARYTPATRIYVDESGTHDEKWLIIGMLFVENHGALHSALCRVKDRLSYFNTSSRKKSRYRETHLTKFRSRRDLDVGKEWLKQFVTHQCYYRCVVVDWGIWDGSYFGDAFEAESLKKRRAYKKWAEMLIQPELMRDDRTPRFYHAKLYLDRLRVVHHYDVLDHLRSRFTENYQGDSPYIESFEHTESWKDANQCLQLCDLLTGCMYQALVPAGKQSVKTEMRDELAATLEPHGIKHLGPEFWKQYAPNTLTKHFPKFSAWFWRPAGNKKRGRRRRQ